MGIFDDQAPVTQETPSRLGAVAARPYAVPRPTSSPAFTRQIAEGALPVLEGMAVIGALFGGKHLAETRAPGFAQMARETTPARMVKGAEKIFAPTSTTDRGIDLSPMVHSGPAGPNVAGGIMTYPERASPFRYGTVGNLNNNPANMLDIRADTLAKDTAAVVRETGGRHARLEEIAKEQSRKNWIDTAGYGPNEFRAFMQFVEKSRKPGDTDFMPMPASGAETAKRLGEVLDQYRTRIEDLMRMKQFSRGPTTIDLESIVRDWNENYFPRQYNETPGKSFALKKRTYLTYEDALAAGYTPKWTDPVTYVNNYVSTMSQFLQKQEALTILEQEGKIRGIIPKFKGDIPTGWEAVNGYTVGGFGRQAYAPDTVARIINNRFSTGLTGPAGEVFRPLQHGFNMIKGGAFALSQYHLLTTGLQMVASDMQRALKLLPHDPVRAFGVALASPISPFIGWRDHKRLQKAYLSPSPGASRLDRMMDYSQRIADRKEPRDQTVAYLFEKGGGRIRPYEQADDYHFSSGGSYFKRAFPLRAASRAAFRMQMEMEMSNFKNRFKNKEYWAATKNVFGQVGRVMDTLMQPTFQHYVPAMKNAAFYRRMVDWLDTHPLATEGQAIAASREILDSVDNRFGEMVQDNIFWDKTTKQIAKLATVSYSYELGTASELGGGSMDISRGRFSTERAAYVIALPIAYGYMASIYQFLHTGQAPGSLLDLVAPQTGGIDPRTGKPERVYPIGDSKDFDHLLMDPYTMVTNKLAPGPTSVIEMLRNSDWKGDPIHPPEPSTLEWISAYFTHLGNAMMPITLQTQYGKNTGFTWAERNLTGMRPAGMNFTDPERAEAMRKAREQRAWQKRLRFDKRQENYYGESKSIGGVE